MVKDILDTETAYVHDLHVSQLYYLHNTCGFKRRGGLSTLCLGTYIVSLYYYPVLCEHGKKGGAAPPSPLWKHQTLCVQVTRHSLFLHRNSLCLYFLWHVPNQTKHYVGDTLCMSFHSLMELHVSVLSTPPHSPCSLCI